MHADLLYNLKKHNSLTQMLIAAIVVIGAF